MYISPSDLSTFMNVVTSDDFTFEELVAWSSSASSQCIAKSNAVIMLRLLSPHENGAFSDTALQNQGVHSGGTSSLASMNWQVLIGNNGFATVFFFLPLVATGFGLSFAAAFFFNLTAAFFFAFSVDFLTAFLIFDLVGFGGFVAMSV